MIVFKNKGEIDVKSIVTFGVSSKDGDNAIGFFGTGLKYAISILLRLNHKITIYSGLEKYEFSTTPTKVRNDVFDVVTMNGEWLGFTTQLGKTWELWQAFREIHCNTVDENGDSFALTTEQEIQDFKPEEGFTCVVVEGSKFKNLFFDPSEVLLQRPVLYSDGSVSIHLGSSKHVYYQGIRAYTLSSPSLYTYNIKNKIDLTEDRTIKYEFLMNDRIKDCLSQCNNLEIINKVLVCDQKNHFHEYSLEFAYCSEPSDEFKQIVNKLVKDKVSNVNKTALELCNTSIMKSLEGVRSVKLSSVDSKRLDKAVEFCESLGFNVTEYPVVVTDFLGDGVLGRACNETIYLSDRVFMMGTKMLAGTILEEYIHLKHRLHDETRELQNYLFDLVVTLGEKIQGEPL